MAVTIGRRELLLGAVLAASIISPGFARAPRQILFVCQFGTVKSPIARELLRRRAAERGIAVTVRSRGITPEPHISAELKQRLAREGLNPAGDPLRRLKRSDLASADVVIAFDRLPAGFHPRKLEDWSDLPSMNNDYDRARSVLDARLDRLLDWLSAAR